MTQTSLPLGCAPSATSDEVKKPAQRPSERHWKDRPAGCRGSPAWNAVADALHALSDPPVQELYRIAARKDPRIRELTLRQFWARVPMQIRRAAP